MRVIEESGHILERLTDEGINPFLAINDRQHGTTCFVHLKMVQPAPKIVHQWPPACKRLRVTENGSRLTSPLLIFHLQFISKIPSSHLCIPILLKSAIFYESCIGTCHYSEIHKSLNSDVHLPKVCLFEDKGGNWWCLGPHCRCNLFAPPLNDRGHPRPSWVARRLTQIHLKIQIQYFLYYIQLHKKQWWNSFYF